MTDSLTQSAPSARETVDSLPVTIRPWAYADSQLKAVHRQLQETPATAGDILTDTYAEHTKRLSEKDLDTLHTTEASGEYITLLLLEAPAATRAAQTLEQGGLSRAERIRHKKVVSQFNKDLVMAMSDLPKSTIPGFVRGLARRSHELTNHHPDLPTFNEHQLAERVRGMEREVAFTRAARQHNQSGQEWWLRETTVDEDLWGIDTALNRGDIELLFDLKAEASFKERLYTYLTLGTITATEFEAALGNGYLKYNNVHILNADHFGVVKDFEYVRAERPDGKVVDGVEEIHALIDKLFAEESPPQTGASPAGQTHTEVAAVEPAETHRQAETPAQKAARLALIKMANSDINGHAVTRRKW